MKRGFVFALMALTLTTGVRSQTANSIDNLGFVLQFSSHADDESANSPPPPKDPDSPLSPFAFQPDVALLANRIVREKLGIAPVSAKKSGGLWISGNVTEALAQLRWIVGPENAELLHLESDNRITLDLLEVAKAARADESSPLDAALLLADYMSTNEGFLLILQVTKSANRYLLHIGGRVATAAGEVNNSSIMNLDNKFDSRISPYRRNGAKLGRELPPRGFDSLVAIDPTIRWLNLRSKLLVSPGSITFHELAEAYAKVELGLDYLSHGSQPGAHEIALEREEKLMSQRPLSNVVGTRGLNRILRWNDVTPDLNAAR